MGDTVTGGFLDNRYWNRNPDKVIYLNAAGEKITYRPLDIEAFYLLKSQEWYRGRVVTVDNSSHNTQDVVNGMNQAGNQLDTVFLRMIVNGRISLYYLKGELEKTHFLIEKEGDLQELRLEKKAVTYNGTQRVIAIDHYKRQLEGKMIDSPEKLSAFYVRYFEKQLLKLVNKYNSQFEGGTKYQQPSKKPILSMTVIAGMNSSSLNIVGPSYTEPKAGYGMVYTPFAGIGLEVVSPRSRNSWTFNNDLIYRYYSIADKFESTQLKLFTSIRYRLPTGRIRPFIGAGITNSYALSGKSTPKFTTPDFRNYEQGLLAEAGVSTRRIFGTVRYEKSDGFSPYVSTATRFSNFYFTIGYRITHD